VWPDAPPHTLESVVAIFGHAASVPREVDIRGYSFSYFQNPCYPGSPLFEIQSNLVRAEDAGLRPVDAVSQGKGHELAAEAKRRPFPRHER